MPTNWRARRGALGSFTGITIAAIVWMSPGVAVADQQTSDSVSSVSVDIVLDSRNVGEADQQYFLNLEDCEDLLAESPDIAFVWNFIRDPASDSEYTIKIQRQDESCTLSSLTTESTDDCLTLEQQVSFTSDTVSERFEFGQIFYDLTAAADCSANSGTTYDVAMIFTAFTQTTTDSTDDTELDEVRFKLVTQRPSAPTGLEAEAGESSIGLDWTEVSTAERYRVYYSTTEFSVGDDPSTINAYDTSTTSVGATLNDNIVRNATYYVAVTTEDEYGNESLLSEVVMVTTQPVTDFYEYYRMNGGQEVGGYCATATPTGGWLLTLLVALTWCAVVSRRRR